MKDSTLYREKDENYFENERGDILPLLPPRIDRLLEIGCGSGNTLKYVKENYGCKWTCGVELVSAYAEKARLNADLVIEGDIENLSLPIEKESIDVILCLDVLEHLMDPWRTVYELKNFLRPGGVFIACIPNVRNIYVIFPLIFQGKWEYSKEGILDKTHIRFFTKNSTRNLMECAGLSVELIKDKGISRGSKAWKFNLATFFIFKDFFIRQYLIRARKD